MAKNKQQDKQEKAETSPLASHPRLLGLVTSGAYRTARAEASKALGDPAASEADKAAAREVLQRTGLEPGTLGFGLFGVAVLLVILSLVFL